MYNKIKNRVAKMAKLPTTKPSITAGPDWLNAIIEKTQNRDDLVANIAKLLQTAIEKRRSHFNETRDVQITSPAPNKRRVIVKDHDGETDISCSLQHDQTPNHEKGVTAQSLSIMVDVKAGALIGQNYKDLAGNVASVLGEATLGKVDMKLIKDNLIRSHSETTGMQSTTIKVQITDSAMAQDVAGQTRTDAARGAQAQSTLGDVVDHLTR